MRPCCGPLSGFLVGFGVLGVVLGGMSIALYDTIYDAIFTEYMVVAPGSLSYDMWKELPLPMYLKVYYFNCTNFQDVVANKAKPLLKQIGPYTFREEHLKTNITFHPDHTVEYLQRKTWHFEPDMSSGDLDDEFYTLNVIAVTASDSTRWPDSIIPDGYPFLRQMMNAMFKTTNQTLFMKTNVRNITFDGIDSPLLSGFEGTPLEGAIQMPFDKFGWFYDRNGSEAYDGVYEMWTGEGDLQNVGQITKWQNHSDLSRYYPSPCSTLTGSAGEFFPPNRDKTSISYFTTDLCRTIFFDYKEETEVVGVAGYKYTLGPGLVANQTSNSSNACFNPHPDLVPPHLLQQGVDPNAKAVEGAVNIILYNGLLNVTECKFNAPAYVSFPHFYLADPQLMEPFHPESDFSPNADEHESYLTVMPVPGIPLDVSIRMQINILVRPLPYVDILEDVDTMFYPMIWFDTYTVLNDDLAGQLRLLEVAPRLGNILGGLSVGLGGLFAILGAFLVTRFLVVQGRGEKY